MDCPQCGILIEKPMVLHRVFSIQKSKQNHHNKIPNLFAVTDQSQLSGWVQVGLHVSQSSAGIKGTRGLLLNAELFARNIQKELWAPSP